MSTLRRFVRVLAPLTLPVFLLLLTASCGSALVGPANAPVPCPVRCSTGLCCDFNTSCVAGNMCRSEDPWPYGVSRDAGPLPPDAGPIPGFTSQFKERS